MHSDNTKFTGTCLCRKILYEVNGPIGTIVHCHCSQCRKWHGSAFRTRASIKSEYFQWTMGEDFISYFHHTDHVTKTFCRNCGSSLVSFYPKMPEFIGIALGTLNEDPIGRPEFHVFVDSKAPWYEIHDDLPQYDELPLGDDRVFKSK